jgi:DNA-binding NtrC family response regulator
VWVIENLRERCQLLDDMLTQERFTVEGLEDARVALQRLPEAFASRQEKLPELIVCNARMLGDTGLELLARLCAHRPWVPVILYSAFTSPKLRSQMARVDGAWILDQPFNPEHLLSVALSVTSTRRTAG